MKKISFASLIFLIALAFVANGQTPTINYLNPSSGPIGTLVTITGSGFAATGNTIVFQNAAMDAIWEEQFQAASPDNKTLTFTVPSYIEMSCRFPGPGVSPTMPPCAVPALATPDGPYLVYVLVGTSESNIASFTVTSIGTPSPITPPGPHSIAISSNVADSNLTVTIDPPGSTYKYPVIFSYGSPTTVTVTANNFIRPDGSGYACVRFEGAVAVTGSTATLLVEGSKTLTAVYAVSDPVVTPAPTSGCLIGDVNNSGAVDIVDALLVAQYYVSYPPVEIWNICAWDVDKNGVIDIIDALRIAQCYVGLISCSF
jgi:hypothetical protein